METYHRRMLFDFSYIQVFAAIYSVTFLGDILRKWNTYKDYIVIVIEEQMPLALGTVSLLSVVLVKRQIWRKNFWLISAVIPCQFYASLFGEQRYRWLVVSESWWFSFASLVEYSWRFHGRTDKKIDQRCRQFSLSVSDQNSRIWLSSGSP